MKKPKLTQKEKFKLLEQNLEAFEKYRLNFVKAQLRRASVWKWPASSIALDNAKLDGLFKCAECKSYYTEKNVNRDHIESVENVVTGYTDLDNYVKRLLVKSDQIQILCLTCHNNKTQIENELRKKYGHKVIINRKKKKNKFTIKNKSSKINK